MYYKVIHNGRVVDVLSQLIYLKYDQEHGIMVLCNEDDAQAIMSSDTNRAWHEPSLYRIPVPGYDTVSIEEIDRYEYEQLKALNYMTPQEIIDAYTMSLIREGVIQ